MALVPLVQFDGCLAGKTVGKGKTTAVYWGYDTQRIGGIGHGQRYI
jgi:hypothetical protein